MKQKLECNEMGKEGYEGMERRSVEGAKGERDLQVRVE